MTSELDLAAFTPHKGTSYQVDIGSDKSVELELIEVVSIRLPDVNRNPQVRQEPFRLTFRGGPPDAFLPQQIHKMRHAVMGDVEIFLVPIGPDSEGMCYEAIFN